MFIQYVYRQRVLAQLVGRPGGTPQLSGSIPGGDEFRSGVKKIPSSLLSPQSTVVNPTQPAYGACAELGSPGKAGPVYGAGGGFGGFLDLRERSSLAMNARGLSYPPQVEFFLEIPTSGNSSKTMWHLKTSTKARNFVNLK